MIVRRCREVVRCDLDSSQAHGLRTGRATEVAPVALDVSDRDLASGAVVQVGDLHASGADPTIAGEYHRPRHLTALRARGAMARSLQLGTRKQAVLPMIVRWI